MMSGGYRDRLGNRLDYLALLTQMKKAFPGPIFAAQQHGIGHGVLGGEVVSHFEQGRSAGMTAAAILSGVPVAQIKVADKSPNVFMFDDIELARLRIADHRLPPESIIINRPQETLKTYAEWLIASAIAIGLQMTLIIVLFRTIRHRGSAENGPARKRKPPSGVSRSLPFSDVCQRPQPPACDGERPIPETSQRHRRGGHRKTRRIPPVRRRTCQNGRNRSARDGRCRSDNIHATAGRKA